MANKSPEQNIGRYKSMTVEGFRLFERLELTDLAPVNLFFGPNNAGKSSILEAVFAHACGYNLDPFLKQCVFRRTGGSVTGVLDLGEQILLTFRDRFTPPYAFTISAEVLDVSAQKRLWDTSPHTLTATFEPGSELANLDPRALGQPTNGLYIDSSIEGGPIVSISRSIEPQSIVGPVRTRLFLGTWAIQLNGGEKARVDLHIPAEIPLVSPFKQAVMHDILGHRNPATGRRVFSLLKRSRLLAEFTAQMAQVFEDVTEIDLYPYPDNTPGVVMVITPDGQQRPLYVFGDGMRRWFYLLGNMIVYKNAIHCIEEIDATLHPDAQQDFARLLVKYTQKYQNQLFVTSHSIEFLDAFLAALYAEESSDLLENEDPVRVFTILPGKLDGQPEVWSRTGREAYKDRQQYGMELRG